LFSLFALFVCLLLLLLLLVCLLFDPPHISFSRYPHCLFMLDLLQDDEYRRHLTTHREHDRKWISEQQKLHWQNYTKIRFMRDPFSNPTVSGGATSNPNATASGGNMNVGAATNANPASSPTSTLTASSISLTTSMGPGLGMDVETGSQLVVKTEEMGS
jgi:hypothetical protein